MAPPKRWQRMVRYGIENYAEEREYMEAMTGLLVYTVRGGGGGHMART